MAVEEYREWECEERGPGAEEAGGGCWWEEAAGVEVEEGGEEGEGEEGEGGEGEDKWWKRGGRLGGGGVGGIVCMGLRLYDVVREVCGVRGLRIGGGEGT